jgi:hypothetical protein
MMGFSQLPPLNRCMVAFPDDYKLLVPRLLIETMNSISASFVTRIDTFTSEATAASRALGRGTFLANGPIGEKICHLASETCHFNRTFECNLFYLFILFGSLKSFEFRLYYFFGSFFFY